jgi:phosphatidylserine decarboxylase
VHKSIIPSIHPEGLLFSLIFIFVSYVLWQLFMPLGLIGGVLTVWCLYFFRNPDRITPTEENLVISPADGVVQLITSVVPPVEMNLGTKKLTRISIFMNVFNVHINRIPINGTVKVIHYHPGKFLNAALEKASEHNERKLYVVENKKNKVSIGFIQIAGLIARRIRCDIKEGQSVKAGERFGLIRFGSRVDVFLPQGVSPLVIEGQLTIAGETVLADLDAKSTERKGAIR